MEPTFSNIENLQETPSKIDNTEDSSSNSSVEKVILDPPESIAESIRAHTLRGDGNIGGHRHVLNAIGGNLGTLQRRRLKIIFLGDSGSGKSAFILSLCGTPFQKTTMCTVGLDMRPITIEVDNEPVQLHLWDTGGQERHNSISTQYMRDMDGLFVMYECTSASSLRNIPEWIDLFKENVDGDIPFVIVGNKSDLKEEREVTFGAGRKVARRYDAQFFECSAKDGSNVQKAAQALVREIKNRNQTRGLVTETPLPRPSASIRVPAGIRTDKTKSKKGCC